jgi:hypothetical protein
MISETGGIIVPWTLNWSSATTLTVPNVANGRYTFTVKARNRFGREGQATKSIEVRRELPIPAPVFPGVNAAEKILPNGDVTFRMTVAQGEDGERYDIAVQIAEEIGVNPLRTRLVDGKQWFDSYESAASFTGMPVAGETGGTVTFAKTLELRKRYYWKAKLSVYRAGQRIFSGESATYQFTTGILGTKLNMVAVPTSTRADGVSSVTVRASVADANNNIDTQWTGVVSFSLTSGNATFTTPSQNVAISAGLASTVLTDTLIETVVVKGQSNYLTDGGVTINFIANRLPSAPVWLDSTFNLPDVVEASTKLYCTVPADLDNDKIHMKMEIDISPTFDNPWLFIAETKFDRERWQYFNGTEMVAFPAEGVPQGVAGTYVCYEAVGMMDGKRYYCRAAATDSYER